MAHALPREHLPKVSGRMAVEAGGRDAGSTATAGNRGQAPRALARCSGHIWELCPKTRCCQHSQLLLGLGPVQAGNLRGPQPLFGPSKVNTVGGRQEWTLPRTETQWFGQEGAWRVRKGVFLEQVRQGS